MKKILKKVNNLIFSQKGKEKPIIRFYLVLLYTFLIGGIIFACLYSVFETEKWKQLNTYTVQRELSVVLLDPSITSETVKLFESSWISGLEKDLSKYRSGYEYGLYLSDDIWSLSYKMNDPERADNIMKVDELHKKSLEWIRSEKLKYFNFYYTIREIIFYIFCVIFPLFLFFRIALYYILLYIIFGNIKNN